ncbi:MAG: TerB family tellurite resistance protein [Geminicoccaceae bacterium]
MALADEELHDYEASLIRRLCGLLYVTGRESAEARNRARERLALLPPPRQ